MSTKKNTPKSKAALKALAEKAAAELGRINTQATDRSASIAAWKRLGVK